MGHPYERLQCHACQGKTPDEPQQRPAPRTAKHTKREWRVRTRNEEKDRGVFDDLKHTLGFACRWRVIDGGGKVKQHHGSGKNTRADNGSRISVPYCIHDEKRGSHERRDQPYTMADTVRDFFTS